MIKHISVITISNILQLHCLKYELKSFDISPSKISIYLRVKFELL